MQVSDNSCYVKAPVRYTDHDVFVALFGVMGTVCNLILPASDVVRSPCFRGMGPSHSSLSEVTPTHVIRLTCHEARASSTQPPAPPPAARGGADAGCSQRWKPACFAPACCICLRTAHKRRAYTELRSLRPLEALPHRTRAPCLTTCSDHHVRKASPYVHMRRPFPGFHLPNSAVATPTTGALRG